MRSMAFLIASSMLVIPARADADEIGVAVAASFLGTLNQLAPLFKHATGHDLRISTGSSGQLYTQIKNGAPFDVMLSADRERPAQLEHDGLGVAGSRYTYAVGRLVLWSPKPGVVDAQASVLRSQRLRFVAIAEPRSAPFGAAAERVLGTLGLREPLRRQGKIVIGDSVSQAFQFAASGNADCAFVALSQVVEAQTSRPGSHWLVPETLHEGIAQDAVQLARGAHVEAARLFLGWLRQNRAALALIRAAGYRAGEP